MVVARRLLRVPTDGDRLLLALGSENFGGGEVYDHLTVYVEARRGCRIASAPSLARCMYGSERLTTTISASY